MLLLILAVLFILFVLETVFTETENFGWATITLLVTVVGSIVAGHFFHTYSAVDLIRDHGLWTLVYLAGYVMVGVLWSFAKWFSYLVSFRDAFREQKEAFLKEQGLDVKGTVPDELLTAFKEYVRVYCRKNRQYSDQLWELERPRASKNKARITAWASFWPFSFVGTVLNDPVRRLFNFLFNQFKALYQKMADRIFAKDVELT